MTLFLDTNVLLDVLLKSRPSHMCSVTLLTFIKRGLVKAVISTQSIVDASFVYV